MYLLGQNVLEWAVWSHSFWTRFFFFFFNFFIFIFWLFLKIIYFNWWIITWQYHDDFCCTSTWTSHRYTCVPPSWNPLPYPSPPHPSGLSQSTSFGCPASCIKFALVIYFTYGNIHASVLFSHIQKSVLYIYVSCCLAYRVIITIFLNSIYIYINILYWCFPFWLTSLCIIDSSFIHLIRTDSDAFFFHSWVIFHCVYVPQLPYPFICWWTSRLLPCPSYCKQCCDEHWGTRVSFNSGFLGVYAQQCDFWVVWQLYFLFLK